LYPCRVGSCGLGACRIVVVVKRGRNLAFAITVWKCQGGTFKYIIALLEHTPGNPALSLGSFLCLSAWGAFLRSSSLLCFLSSRTDECMGHGGLGLMEYSVTTGRLGLGLLGLEGEALGSSALLAHNHDNQLFLGLGR